MNHNETTDSNNNVEYKVKLPRWMDPGYVSVYVVGYEGKRLRMFTVENRQKQLRYYWTERTGRMSPMNCRIERKLGRHVGTKIFRSVMNDLTKQPSVLPKRRTFVFFAIWAGVPKN